ncbi:hypothetical protein I4F81_001247 [Pyropia yezoensis]|uniref:Uncharacterized protein n=1 Tax=Pyropia yezoensis TaxID=2788 RepID=A0ACC3BKY8_PYRYE|nr:hypothetical protein I4F81_001247 [Neopyropia yezoensis]
MCDPTTWDPLMAGAPHLAAPTTPRCHSRVGGSDTRPCGRPTPPSSAGSRVSTCGQSGGSGCGTALCTCGAVTTTSCTPRSSCNTCPPRPSLWRSSRSSCRHDTSPPPSTCRSGCRSGCTNRVRTCRAPPPSSPPCSCPAHRRRR